MIHIVDPQTNEILDYITLDNIIDDTHKKSLESYIETYDAIVLGGDDFSYDKHLEKRNHIIIPDENGTYQEFILFEVDKYRDSEGRKTHFYAHATYLELKKAKVIYPTRREGLTLSQHAGWALNDTGWRVGIVESEGVRTFNIENHTNPYEFLKRIANEFDVELRFRVEHDGRRITERYVDFLERIGDWKGREVEFGRDLDSIRRIEKQDVVTALLGLGPERDDGTRIEVLVEDEEALQRWGRVDEHGNLHHLIEPYEIQSDREKMTEEEARQYTRTALDKRINTQVTYETTILDLEEVPGLEHEKIRFGDTIRIKDTYFNPPLYLEARVYEIERSIKSKAKKDIKLGDFIEFTEEEVNAIWNQLRNEITRRMNRLAIVSITSTAGNVFKNAQGMTELTARTFVSGAERDEQGTLYDYQWMRFDKDGNHDTDFYAEGKTITVKASDIDEKATYRVLVAYELEVINTAEITISNVFDGEDGEPGPPGPKGEDGQGVDNITIQYYLSDSDSTPIGGTWTETKPSYQPGKYLWMRQKITYKNPTEVDYTTPILDDSWKAIEIAEEAKDDALKAVTTADGKNTVIFSTTEPSIEERKIGDIWFDTSRDNLMHRFNGQQWVEAKWGERSLAAESVTALHIKSLEGLNVNDQFIVDSDGNVKFAGHLEGASGTFSGEIESSIIRGSYFEASYEADGELPYGFSYLEPESLSFLESSSIDREEYNELFRETNVAVSGITVSAGRYGIGKVSAELTVNGLEFDQRLPGGLNPVGYFYVGTTIEDDKVHGFIESDYNVVVEAQELLVRGRLSSGNVYLNGVNSLFNDVTTLYLNGADGVRLVKPGVTNAFFHVDSDSTGARIHSMGIYNRTYSGNANMFVTNQGTLGRITSAKKYKEDIQEVDLSNGYAERILQLKPKSWYDKTEIAENGGSTVGLDRRYGLIAEDVVEAGLSEYALFTPPDENGNREVDGIAYDRLWTLLIPVTKSLKDEIEWLKHENQYLKQKVKQLEEMTA